MFTPVHPCFIYSERHRPTQVITNFLTNACKFTFRGTIRMGYEEIEGGLRFYVSDTGKGISKENLPHVFERFAKFDNFIQGTGLGLSICLTIVKTSERRDRSRIGRGERKYPSGSPSPAKFIIKTLSFLNQDSSISGNSFLASGEAQLFRGSRFDGYILCIYSPSLRPTSASSPGYADSISVFQLRSLHLYYPTYSRHHEATPLFHRVKLYCQYLHTLQPYQGNDNRYHAYWQPQQASQMACINTSASLCPCNPIECSIRIPPNHNSRSATNACTS